jgi:aryl-alcohol dehydrogenase-like predicted oxidoreductase
MEYTNLGRTGLKVSRLCLGTMNFGPQTDEASSFEIMDHALEMGINFFDTANVYGWKIGEGITEQIIGRWLAQGGGRREQIVLATKVYGRMGDGPNERRLSAFHIRQACEESLRRMQTDHIDLYQMHHIVREGKVLYVGSSNFAGWHIAQAQAAASARNFMGLVSEQSLYNLMERSIELEVIPACDSYGVGLIPWSPLAHGLLAGSVQDAKSGRRANEDVQKKYEAAKEKLGAYEEFCQALGEEPIDVALAWLLHQPVVTAPIIGPRTMEQLTGSARALEIALDEEALEKLDELWPGPGGPAPEAYAW